MEGGRVFIVLGGQMGDPGSVPFNPYKSICCDVSCLLHVIFCNTLLSEAGMNFLNIFIL